MHSAHNDYLVEVGGIEPPSRTPFTFKSREDVFPPTTMEAILVKLSSVDFHKSVILYVVRKYKAEELRKTAIG